MASLEDLQREYNKRENPQIKHSIVSNSTERVRLLKNKFGNAFFSIDDIMDVCGAKTTQEKRSIYAWIYSQANKKIFYKENMGPGNNLYRVVYVPDSSRLSKDEQRIVNAEFNRIREEAKKNKKQAEVHRTESYKDLAYRLKKEDKYLPLEPKHSDEKPDFAKEEKETPKITIPKTEAPAFKAIEKILLPSGMVDISTTKEANRRYDLRGDDKLEMSIKLTKGDKETFTFNVKNSTRIELLQKVLSILEATK